MPIPRFSRATHVLVVDDDATNLIVSSKLCMLFGGTFETSDCAQHAVYLCATCTFDLVLMDVRMPKMTGVEATIAIRALPAPASRVPIVGVTGDTCATTEQLCLTSGMNVVVQKPISVHRLFDAMNMAIASNDDQLSGHWEVLARS